MDHQKCIRTYDAPCISCVPAILDMIPLLVCVRYLTKAFSFLEVFKHCRQLYRHAGSPLLLHRALTRKIPARDRRGSST